MKARQPVRPGPVPSGARRLPPLVEPSPGYRPQPDPWQQVFLLPDQRTLHVVGLHANWNHPYGTEIDESDPDTVLLTVFLADNSATVRSGLHTLEGYPYRLAVTLGRPLAGRSVADGALPTLAEARRRLLETAAARRAELGLPADPPLLEGLLYEAEERGRDAGDLLLTSEESAWYAGVQIDKRAARDFVHGWLARQPGDVDAGQWNTWVNGGAIVQAVTANAEDLRASAAALGIERLEVRTARRSLAQLLDVQRQIRTALAAARVEWVSIGPVVQQNVIAVAVPGDPRAAQAVVAGIAPDDAVIVPSATPSP